ncbi:MAG: fimbrillin family protein [Prevotella sp.]|uniref:fimbrillin family protein n=1 Tax=Prevotella sp. TaxID=59823 RepID=UPI002A7FA208|nr:fimbrillin family protein [Prevotella sp.]MDY4020765.1 fimbrillin family protein [Prevotella sp.]
MASKTLAAAAVVLLLSCADTDWDNSTPVMQDTSFIFDVTVAQAWQTSDLGSRAFSGAQEVSEESAFPLTLQETEVCGMNGRAGSGEMVSVPGSVTTRAILVNKENFYDNFMLWNLDDGSGQGFEKAVKTADGTGQYAVAATHTPGGRYCAIAPYMQQNESMKIAGGQGVVSSDMSGDVKGKTDVLAAHSVLDKGVLRGHFDFKHIYTAIDFKVGSMSFASDVTIKQITLSGIYVAGDYTISNGTWKIDETKKGTATLTGLDYKIQGSSQDNTLITSSEKGTTFLLLPQTTPADAKATILISQGGKDITLSYPLGNKELKQGYTKTFALGSASNDYGGYVLTVSDPANVYAYADGQTQTFGVTSYRNDGSKSAVAWTVEAYSTDNGRSWSASLPEAMSLGAYSGAGGQQAASVAATLGKSTTSQKETMTRELRTATPVTEYDLSAHDVTGKPIRPSSANCYVVRAGGTYRIPMVMGNTLKDGAKNIDSRLSKSHIDWRGNRVTANNWQVTEAQAAKLMWCDGDAGMFSNVHIEKGSAGDAVQNYLVFTVDPAKIESCNAVLAATAPDPDAAANTVAVWSWHIWITTNDLIETVKVYEDGGSKLTYQLSPIPLGAKAMDENIDARKILVRIRQKESNKTGIVVLRQRGLTKAYDGVFYQWGRKDPFPPHTISGVSYEDGRKNYKTAIKYSWCFYRYDGSWCGNYYSDLWSLGRKVVLTRGETSVKSIYDPCPVGFKMPPARAFDFFNQTPYPIEGDELGFYFHASKNVAEQDINHLIFIPKAGCINTSGAPSFYGSHCLGWSSDGKSITYADGAAWSYLAYTGTYESIGQKMAMGCSVLPITDK